VPVRLLTSVLKWPDAAAMEEAPCQLASKPVKDQDHTLMDSKAAPAQTFHPDPRPPHRPSHPDAQETRVGYVYAVFRQTCPLGVEGVRKTWYT
jgi:hypothetical protein